MLDTVFYFILNMSAAACFVIAGPGQLAAMNMVGAARRYAPMAYRTEALRRIFTAASVLWAVVAAALLLCAAVLYLLTRRELGGAVSALFLLALGLALLTNPRLGG